MEDRELDELTKKLAAPVSRRTVFKAALATAFGGMGAMLTFGRARAQNTLSCHGAGTPCVPIGHNNECCTGYCVDGRCACSNGQAPCVTTTACTSPGQTGCCPAGFPGCEVCCTASQACFGGTCRFCPSNTSLINGQCPAGAGCSTCSCYTSTSGTVGCFTDCSESKTTCTTDADCPAGTACLFDYFFNGLNYCIAFCAGGLGTAKPTLAPSRHHR